MHLEMLMSFDQSLSNWDISNVNNMSNMFNGVTISTTNYDDTLIGWATLSQGESQIPTNITFHGGNSQWCLSDAQRTQLMTATGSGGFGWIITDSNILECQVTINPVAFLQGAGINRNPGEDRLMRDDLRVNGHLPTTSPYADNLTCNATVFNVVGNNAIVDWVWLELRDATNTNTVLGARSALIQRDGDIVDVDGVAPVTMNSTILGDYHLVVNHRNHLGIMSSSSFTMLDATRYFNFSNKATPSFGTHAQTSFGMPNGVLGMWAGDASGNGQIRFLGPGNDLNNLKGYIINDPGNTSGSASYPVSGYSNSDLNLNGQARFLGPGNDNNILKNIILSNPENTNGSTSFPITQQLP